MEKELSNSEIFQNIEEYASENHVPIIRKDEILYLETLIAEVIAKKKEALKKAIEEKTKAKEIEKKIDKEKLKKDKNNGKVDILEDEFVFNILEIGTAIGYSSSKFAFIDDSIYIDTIEKDIGRCEIAKDNIHKLGKGLSINIINGEAKEVLDELIRKGKKYDLVFIDANKSKDKDYFIQSENLITDDGIIICDNIYMSGLISKDGEEVPKKHRTIYRNIHEFLDYLNENKDFKTELVDIADGLTVSYRV